MHKISGTMRFKAGQPMPSQMKNAIQEVGVKVAFDPSKIQQDCVASSDFVVLENGGKKYKANRENGKMEEV